MGLADQLPERDDALPQPAPARRERRRVQPLTWFFAAALLPVLLYDAWQTVRDVKHRHEARGYVAAITGSRHA